jgi:hypothetical protein
MQSVMQEIVMFFKKGAVSLLLLGLLSAPLVLPRTAHAIPAFSRQYKTECSTCHTIYPELNEFGEAFLRNGYVYPGKKGAPSAQAAPSAEGTASEEAKGSKNEWAWLSGLPEQLPVSLTGTLDLAYDDDAFDHDKLDLSARSLRLQAGGAFRDVAGFFITYNLYTQGSQAGQSSGLMGNIANSGNNPPNNSPNIDEMFFIWRNALGTPVNLRVGRLEPKLSLWKRSNKVITVPSYASTGYLVGNSPFSLDAREDALELDALLTNRLLLVGGVVDRNGQNRKDAYGHASYKIGGTDYRGNEPEVDLEKESVWDYLSITLGAFGYSGRNGEFDTLGIARNLNDFYRVGGEMDLLYKRLHLKGSGSFGRDSNPFFADSAATVRSHAYTFEGEYYLGAPVNLIPVFRYEYQEGANGGTHRYIPAIAYTPLQLQNTKLSLEFIYTDAPTGTNKTTLASLAFSL